MEIHNQKTAAEFVAAWVAEAPTRSGANRIIRYTLDDLKVAYRLECNLLSRKRLAEAMNELRRHLGLEPVRTTGGRFDNVD